MDAAGQGTKAQAVTGTVLWWRLRALALGLSHLKRQKQLGTEMDPPAAERHYRECQALLKAIDVPPAETIEQEVLLAG